jgi:hypothetical protein
MAHLLHFLLHMKNYITCFIIFFFVFFPVFPGNRSRGEAELTSEIHNNDEYRVRLSFFTRFFTLVFITKNPCQDNADSILGLSSPLVLYGPVYRFGLFKEIDNPLAYTPTSSVFRERTDVRFNRGVGSGRKRLLAVTLFPGVCRVFLQTGEDVPLSGGGFVSAAMGDMLFIDFFIMTTLPGEQKDDDAWYADSPRYPGGSLCHLGIKSVLYLPPLSVSFTGGASRGDLLLPGFFLNTSLFLTGELYACSGLFGYCSGKYITPGRLYKDRMIRTGGTVDFFPCPRFTLFFCAYYDMDHSSLVPADYVCTTTTVNGKITVEQDIQENSLVEYSLSADSSISYNKKGEKAEDSTMTLTAGLYRKHCTGTFTLSLPIAGGKEAVPELGAGLTVSADHSSLSVNTTLITGGDLLWKGGVDYRTEINKCRLWFSLLCKEPVPVTGCDSFSPGSLFEVILISLGCEVSSSSGIHG